MGDILGGYNGSSAAAALLPAMELAARQRQAALDRAARSEEFKASNDLEKAKFDESRNQNAAGVLLAQQSQDIEQKRFGLAEKAQEANIERFGKEDERVVRDETFREKQFGLAKDQAEAAKGERADERAFRKASLDLQREAHESDDSFRRRQIGLQAATAVFDRWSTVRDRSERRSEGERNRKHAEHLQRMASMSQSDAMLRERLLDTVFPDATVEANARALASTTADQWTLAISNAYATAADDPSRLNAAIAFEEELGPRLAELRRIASRSPEDLTRIARQMISLREGMPTPKPEDPPEKRITDLATAIQRMVDSNPKGSSGGPEFRQTRDADGNLIRIDNTTPVTPTPEHRRRLGNGVGAKAVAESAIRSGALTDLDVAEVRRLAGAKDVKSVDIRAEVERLTQKPVVMDPYERGVVVMGDDTSDLAVKLFDQFPIPPKNLVGFWDSAELTHGGEVVPKATVSARLPEAAAKYANANQGELKEWMKRWYTKDGVTQQLSDELVIRFFLDMHKNLNKRPSDAPLEPRRFGTK